MKKKLISFMLALTLCYAAIPVTAFAEDTNSAPPQFVMEDVETGQKTVSLQNATEVEKVEKLDFRWEQPSVTTQYTISSTVGSGTATWTPANGSTSHTLTLHNVKINSTASYLVGVPANTNIVLEGENVLTAPGMDILVANNGDLTITGSGSLTIIGDYALQTNASGGTINIDIGGTLTVTGRVSSGGAISIKASDISISGMVQAANGYDVTLIGTTGSVDARMAISGKNISVTGKKNVSVGTDYTSIYSVNSTNGIVSLTAEEGEISVVKSIQATGNDANSGSVVLSAKDNITVTGVDTAKSNNIVCNSLTLSGTIPEGSVLAASGASEVLVPANETLSNNGKLLVNCVTVAGTLVDSGMIVNRRNEKVIPTVTDNGVIQTPALVPALDFSNRTEDASGTGFSWDYANKTLTLTDYQLEENSTIVLPDTATLKLEGNNLLKVSGKYLIEARGKLTISGSGSLTGTTDSEIGLYAAGDVTVTDCTLELTVTSSDNKSAAIQTNTHALTIDGTANVTLNAKNAAGSSGIYTGVGGHLRWGRMRY